MADSHLYSTYCNVLGGFIHDGSLLLTNIQHYSPVQLPALRAQENSISVNSPSTAAPLFHVFRRIPLQQDRLRQSSAHNSKPHSPAVYLVAR
jgi:hypothetical protein